MEEELGKSSFEGIKLKEIEIEIIGLNKEITNVVEM